MSLSVSQLRAAVVSQVSSLSGYREIQMLPDYFERTQNTLAHKGFSVGIATSNALPERQRRSVGLFLESVIRVKIAYRIRPSDIILDYSLALDAENIVIGKVLASYASIQSGVELRFSRVTRFAPDSQEYLISDIEFLAVHTTTF